MSNAPLSQLFFYSVICLFSSTRLDGLFVHSPQFATLSWGYYFNYEFKINYVTMS